MKKESNFVVKALFDVAEESYALIRNDDGIILMKIEEDEDGQYLLPVDSHEISEALLDAYEIAVQSLLENDNKQNWYLLTGWRNMKKRKSDIQPSIAPGIDDDKELEQNASAEEVKKGEYTKVITLTNNDRNSWKRAAISQISDFWQLFFKNE